MKEYSITEKKYESQFRDMKTDKYEYFAEFSIELTIDHLTVQEVEMIRGFIQELARRPSAFDKYCM